MDAASVSLLLVELVKLAPDFIDLVDGVEDGGLVSQEDISEILANRQEIDGLMEDLEE